MIGAASGKAILVGEHFAVHGGAALAVPISARTIEVRVARVASGQGAVHVALAAPTLDLAGSLRAMLATLGEDAGALDVTLAGDLPLAAGLGGSAALGAALARALGVAETELEATVHRLEQLAHGTPSGIDGAVACRGAPVWMEARRIVSLPMHASWRHAPWWLAIVPREGSTREAVAAVWRERERDGAAFEASLAASNDDARALRDLFVHPLDEAALAAIGLRFSAAHARLAALGVSNAALERLVAAARDGGAYGAKLTGAGLGGAVIATAPSGRDLAPAFYSAGAVDVIPPSAARA